MESTNQPLRFWWVIGTTVVLSFYLFFLVANVAVMSAMHRNEPARSMTMTTELPQADFARFWFVGKSLETGRDFGAQPSAKSFQINILSRTAGGRIWLYPPTMNLLAMLFAQLPLALSFWVWRVFCWAIAMVLLRYARLPWIVIAAGVLSPAGLHDTLAGQNGTLIGALVVSALMLMDRHPRTAGAIAGMLCIKPQAALIFPFILIQQRRAAFWTCAAVVAGLVGLSFLLEGIKPWIWFITVAQPVSRSLLQAPFAISFPAGGCTVFLMLRSLHASLGWAWAAQLSCSAVAALLIWRLWQRRRENLPAVMAATVSLAVLTTPYGFDYDLTGFAIGMAAMMVSAPMRLKAAFAAFWLASGYIGTLAKISGLLLFPVVAIMAAAMAYTLIDTPKSKTLITA
jgi:alpha-1,2-mannosyltransferase